MMVNRKIFRVAIGYSRMYSFTLGHRIDTVRLETDDRQYAFRHWAVLSQLEQFLQLLDGIVGVGNRVPNRSRISVDLVIISAGEALVAKEVNIFIFNSGDLLLCLNVAETVGLVPSSGEDVK